MRNQSLNRCKFIGQIDDDLELQHENDVPFLRFKMAITKYFRCKDGRKGREIVKPEFEIWDSAAEYIINNAKKGDTLFVVSSLRDENRFRINEFRIINEYD